MPACERCGEWFPSRLDLSECPVCGGLVRSATADPALQDLVRRTHETRDREERRIDELGRRRWATAPLTDPDQIEFDALLERKAAREGKPRARIDSERERQRAQASRREWGEVIGYSLFGCLIGCGFLGIAEIGPLVALRAQYADDGGQPGGLIVAATLISTPLVWVGAVQVLKRLWPRRYGSALLSRAVGLAIAWMWAGLFVFVASRLAG